MRSNVLARTIVAVAVTAIAAATGCAEHHAANFNAAAPGSAASNARPPSSTVQQTRGVVSISDEIRRACGIADEDAYFAFDSSTILATDITPLDAVAQCFTTGPLKGRSLRLVGHADPRGSSDYNLTLGQGRADSVQGYLSRHGLERGRTATTSRGSYDATGTDETGWTKDRRVDVVLGG
jgi:peptidoglycan-associated lipoprotein